MITDLINWQQQADQYLVQGEYPQAATLYEEAIAAEPNVLSNYWHLGLLLLLQGQEAEAQMTWMLPMTDAEEEQIQIWTNELIQVLETEAERRETLAEYSLVWAIRQHIREIEPSDINNLFKIILLSIHLEKIEGMDLNNWGVIKILKAGQIVNLNADLLLQTLQEVLKIIPLHPASLELAEACLPYFSNPEDCFSVFLLAAMKIGHTLKRPVLASRILELYLRLDPQNVEASRHLAIFYQDSNNYSQGIQTAKLCYSLSQELPDKIFAVHLMLRGLMIAGGYWQEVCSSCQELESLLKEFIKAQPLPLDELRTLRLLTPSFAIPHIKDMSSRAYKVIHNQVAQIFQDKHSSYLPRASRAVLSDVLLIKKEQEFPPNL